MALDRQVIEIRPNGGLREDVGKWLSYPFGTLHNLLYNKYGAIEKRPPIRQMSGNIYPSTYPAHGAVVAPFVTPTGELLIAGVLPHATQKNPGEQGICMWSYSASTDRWTQKTPLPSLTVRRRAGIRNQGTIAGYPSQVCVVDTYEAVLYQDSSGGYLRVTDLSSGTVLMDNTLIIQNTGSGNSGKIALIDCNDGVFTFVYLNSTNTSFRRATLDPSTLSVSVSTFGTVWGSAIDSWDVTASETGVFCLVISDAGSTEVWRVNSSSATVTHTHSESGGKTASSIAYGYTTQSVVAFTWEDVFGGSAYVRVLTSSTLTPVTATVNWISGTFDADVINALIVGIDGYSRVHLFATGKTVTDKYAGIRWKILFTDNTLANGGTAYEIPWQTPCGKPFNLGQGCYLPVAHWRAGSTPQPSRYGYALLNLHRVIDLIDTEVPIALEGAFCPTDGLGVDYATSAAHVPTICADNTRAYLPIHVQGRGESGLFKGAEWCDVLELRTHDYAPEELWQLTYASRLTHLPGALPVQFDGQSTFEIAFLEPPQLTFPGGSTSFAETPSATGLEPGDYEYYFTWEWVDAQGNRHESRPSDPALYTVTGGPNAIVTFYVSTTPLTRRGYALNGGSNRPRLVVYRSKKNLPGNHYRVPLAAVLNDPQGYALYVSDSYSDAQLDTEARGQLYTDGGLLERENPPPAVHMQASGGRVWLTSAEDPEVWPSITLLRGEAPAFSPYLRITLDDAQTRLTGTAYLDGLLVIFSEDRIYTLPAGSGPTDNGDGQWPRPEEVQSSGGCIAPSSIISFELGVFYRDKDGFKILTRGRTIENVGEAVRDTSNLYPNTLNCVLDVTRERIYSLCSNTSGDCMVLVFDYRHNAWSTLSSDLYIVDDLEIIPYPWSEVRLSIHNTELVFSYSDRVHRMSDASSVTSPYDQFSGMSESWIQSRFVTPWIMVGAIGGFQRVWRAIPEMEKISDHGLYVNFYNDGDESTPVQTETWTSADISALQGLPRERIVIGVANQKCQSLRIELADTAPTSPATGNSAGFRYHGLSLEIGSKRNVEKAEKGNTR